MNNVLLAGIEWDLSACNQETMFVSKAESDRGHAYWGRTGAFMPLSGQNMQCDEIAALLNNYQTPGAVTCENNRGTFEYVLATATESSCETVVAELNVFLDAGQMPYTTPTTTTTTTTAVTQFFTQDGIFGCYRNNNNGGPYRLGVQTQSGCADVVASAKSEFSIEFESACVAESYFVKKTAAMHAHWARRTDGFLPYAKSSQACTAIETALINIVSTSDMSCKQQGGVFEWVLSTDDLDQCTTMANALNSRLQ